MWQPSMHAVPSSILYSPTLTLHTPVRESPLSVLFDQPVYVSTREGVAERFDEAAVQQTIEVDLALITYYNELLKDLELELLNTAKQHDAHTL
jgi:hypothetical protein